MLILATGSSADIVPLAGDKTGQFTTRHGRTGVSITLQTITSDSIIYDL